MREHPLLYSAPMVRAKLAGTKTHTRRIIAAANSLVDGHGMRSIDHLDLSKAWVDKGPSPAGNTGPYLKVPRRDGETTHRLYPRVAVGDRIWGREAWGLHAPSDPTDWFRGPLKKLRDPELRASWELAFRASWEVDDGSPFWRPSIFMARGDSRILDEVIEVRPERLLDISEADATAEGLEDHGRDGWQWPGAPVEVVWGMARDCYFAGWDTINAERAPAASNPWVWVIVTKPVPR